MSQYDLKLEASADEALGAVEAAAEIWGAEWRRLGTGGGLELPVRAGLRYGTLRGQVYTEGAFGGTRLVFRVEESDYALLVSHVLVLLLGGVGGVVTVLVPFYPALLGLLPLSGILMLLAWFLVASRFRASGAAEFLHLVNEVHRDGDPSADETGAEPAKYAEGADC